MCEGFSAKERSEEAEKGALARPSSCGAPHKENGRGESPSTLVTPAQNTGARNIHDRIVHGQGGRARDRTSIVPVIHVRQNETIMLYIICFHLFIYFFVRELILFSRTNKLV